MLPAMTHPMLRLGHGLPAMVRDGSSLVAIAIAGYCAWTFSGPYRWLVETQMALFGGYRPILTFALLVLVLIVALLGVLQLSRKLGVIPTAGGSLEEYARTTQQQNERALKNPAVLIGALGGAMLLVAFRLSLEGIPELETVLQVVAGVGGLALLVSVALGMRQRLRARNARTSSFTE
jgi:hypothetical protein